jgi:acyl-coenzyme A synthetase/AMP-(fatty) acid ligase
MTLIPLSRLFSERRDAKAIVAISGEGEVDFAQFERDVAVNAVKLRLMGCRRGLLVARDAYWGAVGLMSLHYADAVVVLPNSVNPSDLAPFEVDCVVTDGDQTFGSPAAVETLRLVTGETLPRSLHALDPLDAKIELYTSGSTGQPKCVSKTLADMEAEAEEVHATLGSTIRSAIVFATVPYHHLYGLTFRIALPLSAGWKIVGESYRYWEALAGDLTGESVLVTSPAHLDRLPDLPFPGGHPQLVLSAGAALSDAAARDAARILSTQVTDIFGSTETGVIAYRTRIADGVGWRRFPGVEMRQLGDGRLAVRSRHITHENENGWFQTADLIDLCPDGTFVLRGRLDQVVKIEGNRVSLQELEKSLSLSQLVEAAAVIPLGQESAMLGAAVVLTVEGRQALEEIGSFRLGQRLRQGLAKRHEPAGLPRRWRFVVSLPEAGLGKRKRQDVIALFASADAPTEPEVRSLRVSENGVEINLFLPDTLLQLRGHFPGLPVIPGVALIDWAVKYARAHIGASPEVGREFQIKFRRVITAPSLVTLTLVRKAEQNRIQFEYRQGETVLSIGALKVGS